MSEETGSRNISGSENFEIYETETYLTGLSKNQHLRASIEDKLRILRSHPFSGEPLKYDLDGYRSITIKKDYLIIYGICCECKKHRVECKGYGDNAVVLYTFGKHDDAYKIAKKRTPE